MARRFLNNRTGIAFGGPYRYGGRGVGLSYAVPTAEEPEATDPWPTLVERELAAMALEQHRRLEHRRRESLAHERKSSFARIGACHARGALDGNQ
jgi:hypothetical protein